MFPNTSEAREYAEVRNYVGIKGSLKEEWVRVQKLTGGFTRVFMRLIREVPMTMSFFNGR